MVPNKFYYALVSQLLCAPKIAVVSLRIKCLLRNILIIFYDVNEKYVKLITRNFTQSRVIAINESCSVDLIGLTLSVISHNADTGQVNSFCINRLFR